MLFFRFRVIFFLLFCLLTVYSDVLAQKYTISGYVKDAKNGEELIGASIFIVERNTGVYTNEYGFYSITLPAGSYTLLYRYVSFQEQKKIIELNKNQQLNIELSGEGSVVEDVVIEEKRSDIDIKDPGMSVLSVDVAKIKTVPVLFGETDILKTIQLLPGIQTAGEGSTGFNVRGGGTDQNLILLDEATVYNASHLMGFFSVFNADAIKDIDVYKGGIPAKYGGRLSSLLDIRMREGNLKKYSGTGGIGTIASRFTFEGPIVKDKGSFIVSARRTYGDLFLKLSPKESIRKNQLYFYDFNVKANYRINDNNRIFLSGYFGRDVFKFGNAFKFDWGNATATARWNHLFTEKLFSNITLIYSNFDYGFGVNFSESQNFTAISRIQDYSIKGDLSYFITPKHKLYFGAISTYHRFNPGAIKPSGDISIVNSTQMDVKDALETAIYGDFDFKINDRFAVRAGLRGTIFHNFGPGTEYTYNPNNPADIDTLKFKRGELINSFVGLEPRVSAAYNFNENQSIKASYGRTLQFVHQISNSATTLPVDVWMPSGYHIKPQIGDQYAIGYFINFNKMFDGSIETYYKFMQNQIDYRDGANLFYNDTLERELRVGTGQSYGVELFFRKNTGKLNGWISYTLAKTTRTIPGINNGETYPVKNDRRHNLSIVASYNLNKRHAFGATFVLMSGTPATFPVGSYIYDNRLVPVYGYRNQYRMPAYHRLDISYTLYSKEKPNRKWSHYWNFSIYNVYNRANAYSITLREKDTADRPIFYDPPTNTNPPPPPVLKSEAVKVTLFKIIPAITWNFQF